MKQQEVRKVTIGENNFYIRPLPAFRAANLTGELTALVVPLLSGFAPLLEAVGRSEGNEKDKPKEENGLFKDKPEEKGGLFDVNIADAAPAIAGAFSSLSGDKLENLLNHLVITGGNIAIEQPGEKAEVLSKELADEVFCTDIQDMFILAFEVIHTNYNGFFAKLGGRFGQVIGGLIQRATPRQENTASLT